MVCGIILLTSLLTIAERAKNSSQTNLTSAVKMKVLIFTFVAISFMKNAIGFPPWQNNFNLDETFNRGTRQFDLGRRHFEKDNTFNYDNVQHSKTDFVFPEEDLFPRPVTTYRATAISPLPVPGMSQRPSKCEASCLITPEYNPVCGSNRVTYNNAQRLHCAQRCGKNIFMLFRGRCKPLKG